MINLQKVFIWVPAGATFDGKTVSAENPKKIYFEVDTKTIWVFGQPFYCADLSTDISDITTRIKDIEDALGTKISTSLTTVWAAIETLIGDKTVEGSVDNKVNIAVDAAINQILGGDEIAEAYDTIKEIADWISADPTRSSELTQSIASEVTRATNAEKALSDRLDTLESISLPTLSIKEGSKDFISVDDHQIEIKTTALSSVGLEKQDGIWVAGTNDVSNGLVTAYDVASEIVSDEEVIAAALNDHEEKITYLYNFDMWTTYEN